MKHIIDISEKSILMNRYSLHFDPKYNEPRAMEIVNGMSWFIEITSEPCVLVQQALGRLVELILRHNAWIWKRGGQWDYLLVEHPALKASNCLRRVMYDLLNSPASGSIVEWEQFESGQLTAFLLLSVWTSRNVHDDYFVWGDGIALLLQFGHHSLKAMALDVATIDAIKSLFGRS